MARRKKDSMSDIALAGITSTVTVSQTARAAGGSTAAGLSSGYATGQRNIGAKFPAAGRMKGAGMVLKQVKKLKKKTKGGIGI